VLEYMRADKCKHYINNRIILSTGAFIPCNIPGALFKDHIDKWHHQNPNQLAARQLMLSVISNATLSLQPQLHLHMQLDALTQTYLNRHHHYLHSLLPKSVLTVWGASSFSLKNNKLILQFVLGPNNKPTKNRMQHRNFATPPRPANIKKPKPAYHTMTPVYNDKIATNVYDRAMDSQITLTQHELLSLSPEVHSHVHKAVSTKQSAPKDSTKEIHTVHLLTMTCSHSHLMTSNPVHQ